MKICLFDFEKKGTIAINIADSVRKSLRQRAFAGKSISEPEERRAFPCAPVVIIGNAWENFRESRSLESHYKGLDRAGMADRFVTTHTRLPINSSHTQ